MSHPALATENIFFHWRDEGIDQLEYTMVYWRGSTAVQDEAEIVVAANFDHTGHTLSVAFPAPGYWVKHDMALGNVQLILVSGSALSVDLEASSAIVWVLADGSSGVPLGL